MADDVRPSFSKSGGLGLTQRDLECSICMSLLHDPFVTACGHTFCYGCLATHLQTGKNCPSCSAFLTKELAYPNFLLSKVVKRVAGDAALHGNAPAFEALHRSIEGSKSELTPEQVDVLVAVLLDHKRECEAHQRQGSMALLLDFLQHSREDKASKLEALRKELNCLDTDIDKVEATCTPNHQQQQMSPRQMAAQQQQQQQAAPPTEVPAMQQAAVAQARAQQQHPHSSPTASSFRAEDPAQLAVGDPTGAEVVAALQQRLGAEFTPASCSALAAHPGMAAYLATQHPPPLTQPLLPASQQPGSAALGPPRVLSSGVLAHSSDGEAGWPGCVPGQQPGAVDALPRTKKRRIASQFKDLQDAYLRLRADQLGGEAEGRPLAASAPLGAVVDAGLREFGRILSVLTRCNRLRTVAEIPRPSLRQSSSIVCSIEYDRDGALFAAAGVSKRISIFEHAAVVGTPGLAVHCPAVELVTRSKLSCLSWNRYLAAQLASCDYDGVVALWDVHTSGMVQEYEAHSKRIWSVDFCDADPTLLASGSDDCTVKVWSTRSPSSQAQIDLKANACAVKWRSGSAHELAVGSADHGVHLYDLRRPAQPVAVLTGHRKAVSYVRFCSHDELASASTDSTLRLWRLGAPAGAEAAERVFEGHANDKNFVGLAVEGGLLACGSEANEAVVYYKELSKPVARHEFPQEEAGGSGKTFVSAVCWRPGTQQLVVANSHGTIRVMQLEGDE